jgi:hypothetical protein
MENKVTQYKLSILITEAGVSVASCDIIIQVFLSYIIKDFQSFLTCNEQIIKLLTSYYKATSYFSPKATTEWVSEWLMFQ